MESPREGGAIKRGGPPDLLKACVPSKRESKRNTLTPRGRKNLANLADDGKIRIETPWKSTCNKKEQKKCFEKQAERKGRVERKKKFFH